jgi:hypothetical protein
MVDGREVERLRALVARCEADAGAVAAAKADGDAMAGRVGGEVALRWRIACLRAVIEAPPDADAVHEAYGELVDRYRDDGQAMVKLKSLGEEIRKRERDGSLPRVMVARSARKRPNTASES